MGIIDKNTATLRCATCDISETLTAIEKGSVYGSSGWGQFGDSKLFDIETRVRGAAGPEITTARCRKCGHQAEIGNR